MRIRSLPCLVVFVVCAFLSIESVPGQRRVAAGRTPSANESHLLIAPANVRGTALYLGMTEDHEAMWNRFEYNSGSVQFRLAQMARVGVNNIRLWGSHRAFLRSRTMGSGPSY